MLLSTIELNQILDDSNLIILDASKNISQDSFYIKGARYFNLGANFSDENSLFPNTFPSVEKFEEESRKLGINNESKIVIYDNNGVFNSPRVWFMFKSMGHHNVYVLDGGLEMWIDNGFEVDKIDFNKKYSGGNFKAILSKENVKYFEFIETNFDKNKMLLVDARSALRFNGLAPEPREGISSGSIPNSINIPYTEVLNESIFKSKKELELIFKSLLKEKKEIIFTCGSGVTACILLFAFKLMSNKETSIYDGSWTEWATFKKV
jgi:thiosulfate/3-mercaptopyruvate sulfurtransferase